MINSVIRECFVISLFRTLIKNSYNLLIEKSDPCKIREPGHSVSETNSGVRSAVED